MIKISPSDKQQFQQHVLFRYAKNKRDLPRRRTQDPYKILVSEVMSQQTQVARVIPKYEDWIKRRPTIESFANASRADVLRYWSGLGFNRRAINLHEACKRIVTDHQEAGLKKSSLKDYAYLRSLPGVGDYTASAILAFAYNVELPVIDINIKRVLIHTFGLSPDISLFELQELALSLVPVGKSRERHNALMDYGSTVLHSKATGIRSAKQSTFKGSDREVRGWILKQFAGGKMKLLIQDIQSQRPEKDVEKIIAGLEKDGFVSHKAKTYITLAKERA